MSREAASPTIAHIETVAFRLPLRGALRWGKGHALEEVRHVLVRVALSDGSEGLAEAPPRPTIYGETVHTIAAIIRHELAPRLAGLPAAALHTRLHQVKNNPAARAGVDMAVQAALAQSRGLSLAEHLGVTQERVCASYILGINELEAALAEAHEVAAQGVRVLKVKVGQEWEADLALIEALRAELPGVALYADANECFTAEEAACRLAALAERGLLYCEEPLPVELVAERAALAAAGRLPIIADDSCFTMRALERELALGTFDILNVKTARTGFTESGAMVARARVAGKGVMVGSQAGAGLAAAHAALVAALPGVEHPSELSFFLKLGEDIVERPLPITDGYIHVADALAVRVDPTRLAAAALPAGA